MTLPSWVVKRLHENSKIKEHHGLHNSTQSCRESCQLVILSISICSTPEILNRVEPISNRCKYNLYESISCMVLLLWHYHANPELIFPPFWIDPTLLRDQSSSLSLFLWQFCVIWVSLVFIDSPFQSYFSQKWISPQGDNAITFPPR